MKRKIINGKINLNSKFWEAIISLILAKGEG
jgi:hypothetical protein